MKLVHTSINVATFSPTVSTRETQMFLKLQFGMCSDELLADQLPTSFSELLGYPLCIVDSAPR